MLRHCLYHIVQMCLVSKHKAHRSTTALFEGSDEAAHVSVCLVFLAIVVSCGLLCNVVSAWTCLVMFWIVRLLVLCTSIGKHLTWSPTPHYAKQYFDCWPQAFMFQAKTHPATYLECPWVGLNVEDMMYGIVEVWPVSCDGCLSPLESTSMAGICTCAGQM